MRASLGVGGSGAGGAAQASNLRSGLAGEGASMFCIGGGGGGGAVLRIGINAGPVPCVAEAEEDGEEEQEASTCLGGLGRALCRA